MAIGQAYSDTLTESEQKALQQACDVLIDDIFNTISDVHENKDVASTMLGDFLPPRYMPKYTLLFLRQFSVCIITVAWKLAQAQHMLLASVAEEIAAWTIIREAKAILEEDGKTQDPFEAFIDVYFEDTDFLYLFDNAYDGIDESEVGQMMGVSSLAFHDWFLPFSDEPSRTPHPYTL